MDALKHFDTRAASWDALYKRPQFADRLALFERAVNQWVQPGGTILDYGCGSGHISRSLASRGYKVHGIDGSKKMIEMAAMSNEKTPDGPTFEQIDPESWVPDRTFDAIVCSSVLEYVEHDVELLCKLSSGLVQSGHLLISIPSAESLLGQIEDAIASKERDVSFSHRRYRLADFDDRLRTAGLERLSTTSFEVPRIGRLGVPLSRLPFIGIMRLVVAKKNA